MSKIDACAGRKKFGKSGRMTSKNRLDDLHHTINTTDNLTSWGKDPGSNDGIRDYYATLILDVGTLESSLTTSSEHPPPTHTPTITSSR